MKRILAVAALCLACAATPVERVGAEARAWITARQLGGGSTTWRARPEVRWHQVALTPDAHGRRQLGRYQTHVVLTRDGRFEVRERIDIFILEEEFEMLYYDAVLHEFLHAVYMRRCTTDPAFAMRYPNSEAWVQAVRP